MAASPAALASPSENFCPCNIFSASSARHGTGATPPNTKRVPAKRGGFNTFLTVQASEALTLEGKFLSFGAGSEQT